VVSFFSWMHLTSGFCRDEKSLFDWSGRGKGIGGFDVLAFPYRNATASRISLWSKIELGWAIAIEIIEDGTYTVQPGSASGEELGFEILLKMDANGNKREYLLLENCQQVYFGGRSGDSKWNEEPVGSGLCIYHIDDSADQSNPGFPGQNNWPESGDHYQVALLAADGKYDLEKGTNYGDVGDIWQPGDVLGPGQNGLVFPNTDTYGGGIVVETGISIKVISMDGDDIQVEVTGVATKAEQTPSTSPMLPTSSTATPTLSPSRITPPPITSTPTESLVGASSGAPEQTSIPTTSLPFSLETSNVPSNNLTMQNSNNTTLIPTSMPANSSGIPTTSIQPSFIDAVSSDNTTNTTNATNATSMVESSNVSTSLDPILYQSNGTEEDNGSNIFAHSTFSPLIPGNLSNFSIFTNVSNDSNMINVAGTNNVYNDAINATTKQTSSAATMATHVGGLWVVSCALVPSLIIL
jgi:hypothetical protein